MASCEYDVFLSFRGGDTRTNFADHLYAALVGRGIKAFRDVNSLVKGKEFGPEILKAIEESRSSIVLLSENYASSTWCLDELVKILECKNKQGQLVFPVFYKVDPTDVEDQTGNFGEAFAKLKELPATTDDKVNQWRIALTDVCKINGWDLQQSRYESNFIQDIVEGISNELSIETLIKKLKTGNPADQQSAAGEIRQLAKLRAEAIAKAGAIPPLVRLLSTPDSLTQEHAVTALFNLSLHEDYKKMIMSAGAVVPAIVHVLEKGGMEARENAAATIYSLSAVDEYKTEIGSLGAIPPLVKLLGERTQMSKEDAAAALFKLCIYHDNKGKAVRAGAVSVLISLLPELSGLLLEDAVGILGLLASHPEGKTAIGAAQAVPNLVKVISNGSARAQENAVGILVHLCSVDEIHLIEAYELGVMEPLRYLVEKGNERAKSKAEQLLKYLSQLVEQQTEVIYAWIEISKSSPLPLTTTNSADS